MNEKLHRTYWFIWGGRRSLEGTEAMKWNGVRPNLLRREGITFLFGICNDRWGVSLRVFPSNRIWEVPKP